MGKITGFLDYDRFVPEKRPAAVRINDWEELKGHYSEEEIRTQAARCMNCGVPFCQSGIMLNGMVSGCPLNNLIPHWNDLVYHGKWKDAYERLSRTSPFPEFTSRVCPSPCEGACTEGTVAGPVTICGIEGEIIERAFANGWVRPEKMPYTGKNIAVVGSGPAGLSAAWNLALLGNYVTVFERQEEPGGLLMYGIPNMKLDKRVIKRRIDLMKELGILFECGREAGKDITIQELSDKYDAVVLAIGATAARRLQVPGSDSKGVVMAVDYLKANTRKILEENFEPDSYLNAKDKNVIVIGGGDTGTDCVGTAIRQGAKTVNQFEITSKPLNERDECRNPWPEWPKVIKTDYGQEEAAEVFGCDPRTYEISTTEIIADSNGTVTGVKTVNVNWVNNGGGLRPVPVDGSEKIWDAELVLIAMGFTGPEKTIIDQLKLDTDARGNILTDQKTYETSKDNIFACGDARRGQSLVVWGIAEGKRAAEAVHGFLSGK